MYALLFRSWKVAALWAVAISASIAAFFADGGGSEQIEASAQQIRETRSTPVHEEAAAEPAPVPAPAPAPAPAAEEEAEDSADLEMGQPSLDLEAPPVEESVEGEEAAA